MKIGSLFATKSERETNASGREIVMLERTAILPNPNQPRRQFDDESIVRLADSIKRHGMIHPLTVRRCECVRGGYSYELISGERRLRAAAVAGLETLPCIVKPLSDEQSAEIALIENLLRCDLNVFEQAEAFRRLIERFGLSQLELADRLGLSQSAVANKLRLLRLSENERELILCNHLTERHARALLCIADESVRLEIIKFIAEHKLSVTATEAYIAELMNAPDTMQLAIDDGLFHVKRRETDACSHDQSEEDRLSGIFRRAFRCVRKDLVYESFSESHAEDGRVSYTVTFSQKDKPPRSDKN